MPHRCRREGCRSPSAPGWRYCAYHLAAARDELDRSGYLQPATRAPWDGDEGRTPIDEGRAHAGETDRRRGGRPPGAA